MALSMSLAYWSIAERIGMSKEPLIRDTQVRAIVERTQREARQQRENELASRVEHAIEELVSQGKKVTVFRVSQIVELDGVEGAKLSSTGSHAILKNLRM